MQSLTYFESPTMRGRISLPGLPLLPANMERHPVPGGGSRLLKLDAGDEITIIDREGMQACELVAFDENGQVDPGLIGARASGTGDALRAALTHDASTSRVLRTALEVARVDLGALVSSALFGDGSRPGERQRFVAAKKLNLWVGAPGGPMAVDGHNPPTEILVYVQRTSRTNEKPDIGPPDPLARALIDMNIQPGNGYAYEVKAGQYIQLVDVKGRECTDFQAFSLRALDNGLEREIEPTTTRTLMGAAYPNPGVHSKYFTLDQAPLVEVIQDTCGQHDTFGLACTARYYEDMGYPGHVNCSDNMSRAVEPYGIRARAGWPAVNFFFNTTVDDAHAIQSDEPWSRPGDYVLMRALTDLICLSTACPSDINPANGWNPTDIQVRVYDAKEDFKRATGYRMTADADVQLTQETAFHSSFAAHTRDFVEVNGYWLPNSIVGRGTIEEYWACRERAAVMDLSSLRKFEVLGPDAEQLLQICMTRNIKKLSVGQVVYTAMCYPHGGMIDDGTVFRMDDNCFRWVGGCDASGLWLREKAQERKLDAWVKSSTDQLVNIAVQGPRSREILESILWTAPTRPTIS
ncbi:MAG: DUF1989 domain-containing protein, partial [Gammaproteobacteria bacterium]